MLSLVGYRTNIHISTTKSKKAFAFLQRLLFIGETGLAATQAEPTPRRRSRWAPLQDYKVNRPPADVGLGFLLFVCNLVQARLVHKHKKPQEKFLRPFHFVGETGFEPATSNSRSWRANRTALHPEQTLSFVRAHKDNPKN